VVLAVVVVEGLDRDDFAKTVLVVRELGKWETHIRYLKINWLFLNATSLKHEDM
jgi:hypothetical protein